MKITKTRVLIGILCLSGLGFLMTPILLVAVVGGSANGINCAPGGPAMALTPAAGEGKVRLVHANLKVSMGNRAYRQDLATITATRPDFISLNEVARRTHQELTPRGFAMHRAKQPARGDDGTAVLWNKQRWTKVTAGRTMLVASGPQQWDYDRAATWVTLTNEDVGEISVVSTHQMINPAKYGPNKPLRQRIYRKGMQKLQRLVRDLSAEGPVFVAGDFNSQFGANDPWGPRKMLRPVGLRPTMGTLGKRETHDQGGIIDYLFYQPSVARASRQVVANLNSDHHLLRADFKLESSTAKTPSRPASGANRAPAGAIQPASNRRGPGSTPPATSAAAGANVQQQLMRLRLAENYPPLNAAQAKNAIAIAKVARALGIPRRGLAIAIATAIQESKLENISGGDRDSGGLFQQRPSQGWGTRAEVTNPHLAARAFFGRAQHTDNTGLLDLPGWQDMALTDAAQQVQRSGHPDLYAQWTDIATKIADILGGDLPSGSSTPAAANCPPAKTPATQCTPVDAALEKGLTRDARLVLRKIDARFGNHTYGGVGQRSNNPGSDHPSGRAVDVMINDWQTAKGIQHGNSIAQWIRAHARQLGITYVIWRAKIWNTGDKTWSRYSHPSGGADPTLLHMDHVHISVHGDQSTSSCTAGSGKTVYPVPQEHIAADAHNWHNSGGNWSSWHTGTDFGAPCGTPVYAAHAGTVEVDTSQAWSGPWLVKIATGPSSLSTWYAHMQKVTVSPGQTVQAGEQIGTVGDEGTSTGCHLHFEVHERNGTIYGPDNVNPSDWLAKHVQAGKKT